MGDICTKCGQPIDWIKKDGRSIPIHRHGRCDGTFGSSPNVDLSGVADTPIECVCWPTKCPQCKGDVFFVRHNGGSVWLDDLGQPWPKHECMYDIESDKKYSDPQMPPVFPSSRTNGIVLEIEKHGGTFVFFVQWENKGISMYQCPKLGMLNVNLKLYYDPFDNEKFLRTIKGRAIPLDSSITKRSNSPSLDEIQSMIENADNEKKRSNSYLARKRKRLDRKR